MAIVTNGKIPYAGYKALAKMLMDSDAPHALYVAYGTGTTAVTSYDYRMENESKRELADTVSRTSACLTITNTFAAVTEDISVWELGVFTAPYGGEMVYHAVMAVDLELSASAEDKFKSNLELNVQQG